MAENHVHLDTSPVYSTFGDLVAADDPREDEVDFTLPSGAHVRVRGLTRHELHFGGKGTEDAELIEARNVAVCLMEPKLTLEQVKVWQASSRAGGDFSALSGRIRDLSGLGAGADKSDSGTTGE